MKRTNTLKSMLTVLAFTLTMNLNAQFNKNPTLKIGYPAPEFKPDAFLRGKPVTTFEQGRVYVIDFWATWCGGCIASFPHISAVADKYKDRVRFISIDSYEDAGNNKGKDPLEVVRNFLKTPAGQKLKLNVAVDGKENRMFSTWIKPLRRGGFPTTLVVDQEGKLAWIDVNLDHLDWVLEQVLSKTWDRKKAAVVMDSKDGLEELMLTYFQQEDGDRNKILEEILKKAEAFEREYPDRKDASAFYKFIALSELSKDRVPALLEEMAANPLTRYINLADAAGLSLRRKDLTTRDYMAIAKVQERLLLNPFPGVGYGGKTVSNYEELAKTYENAGKRNLAKSSIAKAIVLAKQQRASPKDLLRLNHAYLRYKS